MQRILIVTLVFGWSCCAWAQEAYLGVSGNAAFLFDPQSITISADSAVLSPGVQLGVRNLLGPIGLRLTGEYSVTPNTGLLKVGGDVLLHLGLGIDPYLGVGAGLATIQGARLGIGRAVVGLGPRLGPDIGLFAEGVLNAYSDGNSAVYTGEVRAGLNFFF